MAKRRTKVGRYRVVFKGTVFQVSQASAVLPSGRVKLFEQASRPPSVIILPFDASGRLLLTREYRLTHKKYIWNLPSGKVDDNESPRQAALRELREEAGFKASGLKLFQRVRGGTTLNWDRHIFIATGLQPAPLNGDDDEDITVKPTPFSRAYRMALKGEIAHDLQAYMIIRLYQERRKFALK